MGMRFLITGASTGIGYALAQKCAAAGHDLVIVARSHERLQQAAQELTRAGAGRIETQVCDLSRPEAPGELHAWLQQQGHEIEALINNAGVGLSGPFDKQDPQQVLSMLAVNITGLTLLTHKLLPGMLKRKHGRILNVGSLAGFLPGPWMAAYYASKAYVNSFSEALAVELHGTGVTVTCLCPGATSTPFIDRAGATDALLFKLLPMAPDTVAQVGYKAMMNGCPMAIAGLRNLLIAQSLRCSPRFAIRRISSLLNRI